MAKKASRWDRKGAAGRRRPYMVFVSHATSDKWLAKTICEKVETVGARTFRDDRDIAGGDSIPDTIRRQIIAAQELLVLVTPESADRQWVLSEVAAAWGRRRNARIVPILCHVKVDRIPGIIRDRKAFFLNELDQYLQELAARLRGR